MTDWTQEREAEIQARCDAATKGPWISDSRVGCSAVYSGPERNCLHTHEPFIAYKHGKWIKTNEYDGVGHWTIAPQHVANHDFIAHARTDLPAALKEIEYLGKIYEETQRHSDGVERENQRLREELISAWPHTAFTCPCSDRLAESAPLDKCDCGLTKALHAPEGGGA